jgi:ATP-dependent Clp protease ATP-binding subunit ClpA
MFCGQEGTGKTELARQLAKLCNMELVQFDMSEFSEAHTVSKLLGSPPGYAGFDQGGQLTDEIDKHKYSVVLFDEIDKAHPEIINLLLQVMDAGTINDNTGKTINFAHTIIILTTNIGGEQNNKLPIGFGGGDGSRGEFTGMMEEVNRVFSNELRNRLDDIIVFKPLDHNIMGLIIQKHIQELTDQLKQKKVCFSIDNRAIARIGEGLVEHRSGARILQRIIDTKIKQPIAEQILFGKLRYGGKVHVSLCSQKGDFCFKFFASEPKIIESKVKERIRLKA